MKLSSLFGSPSPAQREHWQRWRWISRGKKSFVLRVGVIGWGGLMFVVFTASDLHRDTACPHGVIYYVLDVAVNLVLCPVAGYFVGLAMWRVFQKKFSESDGQLPARQQ